MIRINHLSNQVGRRGFQRRYLPAVTITIDVGIVVVVIILVGCIIGKRAIDIDCKEFRECRWAICIRSSSGSRVIIESFRREGHPIQYPIGECQRSKSISKYIQEATKGKGVRLPQPNWVDIITRYKEGRGWISSRVS